MPFYSWWLMLMYVGEIYDLYGKYRICGNKIMQSMRASVLQYSILEFKHWMLIILLKILWYFGKSEVFFLNRRFPSIILFLRIEMQLGLKYGTIHMSYHVVWGRRGECSQNIKRRSVIPTLETRSNKVSDKWSESPAIATTDLVSSFR